jgi:hypothetical protein
MHTVAPSVSIVYSIACLHAAITALQRRDIECLKLLQVRDCKMLFAESNISRFKTSTRYHSASPSHPIPYSYPYRLETPIPKSLVIGYALLLTLWQVGFTG